MGIREQYEAKKAAQARRDQERGPKPWWWLGQPDPIARFTKWLSIYTFLLVVATVVSAAVLWKTDNTLTETAQKQLRVYLIFEMKKIEVDANGPKLSAEIKATNAGLTPAYSMQSRVIVSVVDFPFKNGRTPISFSTHPNPVNILFIGPSQSSNIIGPGKFTEFVAKSFSFVPFNLSDVLVPDKKRILIVAVVYYVDIFNISHYTRYCMIVGDLSIERVRCAPNTTIPIETIKMIPRATWRAPGSGSLLQVRCGSNAPLVTFAP